MQLYVNVVSTVYLWLYTVWFLWL